MYASAALLGSACTQHTNAYGSSAINISLASQKQQPPPPLLLLKLAAKTAATSNSTTIILMGQGFSSDVAGAA